MSNVQTAKAKLAPAGSIPDASIHIGFALRTTWRCDLLMPDGTSVHQWTDEHDSTFSLQLEAKELVDSNMGIRFWISILKGSDQPDEQYYCNVRVLQSGTDCIDNAKKKVEFQDKFGDKNIVVLVAEVTFVSQ